MLRMQLSGDLDLPMNLFSPGDRATYLIKEVTSVLKVVFSRLGHNVRVYNTSALNSRVRSDHGDITEEQDIMHMTNVVFSAFFEADYDYDKTMETLEKQGLIPRVARGLD